MMKFVKNYDFNWEIEEQIQADTNNKYVQLREKSVK